MVRRVPRWVTAGVLPGDLLVRGLTPLLTIALSLLVLAWAERSEPLGIFAVFFVALALLANLYDLSNLFRIRAPEPAINVIIRSPETPCRAMMPATMTTKAPVGPPICTRDPPRAEMRKPATIAV